MALLAKKVVGDSRLVALEESLECLGLFLKRVSSYDGLLNEEIQHLLRPLSDKNMTLRELKIARHRALVSLRQSLVSFPVGETHEDDDWAREMAIVQIRAYSLEAQGEIENILAETNLLRLRNSKGTLDAGVTPIRSSSSTFTPSAKPLKPFMLLSNRQQLREQVFRPGHNLPTLTIDEYLALEKERGGIMGYQTTKSIEEDEDRDEVVDRKTIEERRFDLFKDDNPKGWGNTRNLS